VVRHHPFGIPFCGQSRRPRSRVAGTSAPAGPATAAAVLECERPRWKSATVLTRLLRSFLRRYTRQIAIVVILWWRRPWGTCVCPDSGDLLAQHLVDPVDLDLHGTAP